MRHRLPRSARLALTAVKIALVVLIGVLGWATQSAADGPSSGYAGFPVDDQSSHLDKVLDHHDCSVTGFADGSQPVSAIVRSASGRLRFVSFETGWRVFTAHGAATLVGVCLDPAPQAP